MEYEPGEYQKLVIRQYAPRSLRETNEGRYWRRFAAPFVAQQVGPVSHVHFNPADPRQVAATSATRVIVYDGIQRSVQRTFARFKDVAFSGRFRGDGKLLLAGAQDGIVQVFDASSRVTLRRLIGHQGPCRAVRWASNKINVMSGGDDVTARWWDISTGEQVIRLDGHTDYVRALGVSPSSPETWATGGYDHVVKVWDVRSGSCVLECDHGSPVEDLVFFPSGSLLVSAGGNYLCVWDVISGARLLRKLTNFQKTVTCVTIASSALDSSAGGSAPRMLAGALDGHVKVFELDNFKVTHASQYPAPVLSLGIAPDCSLLAVGLSDGKLSLRRRVLPRGTGPAAARREERARRFRPRLTAGNYRFFLRGQNAKAAANDYQVARRRRARLAPYDKLLKKFRYRDALDAAIATKHPEVVASVLEELAARGGLEGGLGGRDVERLKLLLKHVGKYIADPRYTRLLSDICHRILDAYTPVIGKSVEIDRLLQSIQQRLSRELNLHYTLMSLQGCLEPLLAASLSSLSLEDAT